MFDTIGFFAPVHFICVLSSSRGAKSLLLLDSFVSLVCRGVSFCVVQNSSMFSRGYPATEIRSCRVNWTPVSAVLTFPACCCVDSLCVVEPFPCCPNYTNSIQPNERECNRKESNDFKRLENKFFS